MWGVMTRKKKHRILVACGKCPHCDAQNVVGPADLVAARESIATEHEIWCQNCSGIFKLTSDQLSVRRRTTSLESSPRRMRGRRKGEFHRGFAPLRSRNLPDTY